MRGLVSLSVATGWLVAGIFGFAGQGYAQSGGASRAPAAACDCAQVVADCSASVSVIPIRAVNGAFSADVMLQTDAPSCAKVDYRLDDTPYVTVLPDGAAGGQRLYATRALTRNSVSHLSCHVCAAASAPVPNDGLSPGMARVDGAPGTYSAAPAGSAGTATAASTATTATTDTTDTTTSATVYTPPMTSGTAAQPGAAAPLLVVNPSGHWRGLCTNAPPWWKLWGSPMTRLMALALNGAQVTGSVDDVEPNVHTTVQGTLSGDRLQLAGSYGAKHDITFGANGTTLTDAWCNGDGRCETCEMQRF
ncbi:hypothetical protein OYT13_06740 [Pandoraea sp. XJJ-1]|uniref:hypothetical protein n=1 Tax=unclassified Pandoraea TaxID=2624094 RepID=UPI0021C3881D|nr:MULTISPECIES: hypothetical protein [unclassified Pandoraea]WAL84132.1 hypothetical protein OYT13_06740 [Pandoraea sp. XJJ-1]BDD90598.1 hypothetical protein PanNE5_00380 [Pandoraea sp. NE5]